MSLTLRIIIDVFLAVGAFFALAGTIGNLRMPDTFCRMQASTCIATMGLLGVVIGGLLYSIFIMHSPSTTVKIIVIGLLVFTTNPVGAHAIAKGAYRHGIRPDKEMEIDDFRRDFDE
ncbi:MAG: monovalent cation/H(+) antiporter subunit G [Candidatus Limivicinus sp.]|nr:monovalent cation/H(+) antiporter subunit G [Clostridiales bacterium]MDY3859119.1 monovalent cation/H(+) antiporter subunit G [Candidatus Limivicinus sp.]